MRKNTNTLAISLVVATIALTGVGCAEQTAVAPEQMNGESALSTATRNVGAVAQDPRVQIIDNTNQKPTDMTTETTARPPRPTSFPGVLPEAELAGKYIHVNTSKGEIVFELLPKEGPKAASNFYTLTLSGYYDGLTFHRVEPGFVIQGGDPSGNGTGGPGYKFEDDVVNLSYKRGIVAMANAGPNTNGSQFFIMLEDAPTLPPSYSVFGRVVSGMETVDKIAVGDVMQSVTVSDKK